ncbi:helix-turn-helix domain-containing protein [Candidatus Bathyarchaeota archaeon]|nr:helix-turn-helix domain-containing protein [Candidatus Bathyarchaeota archaeon]
MFKPGEMKILLALAGAKDGLTFTELKKATGLSSPSLSEYLYNLEKEGVLFREEGKYRLPQVFRPLEKLDNGKRMFKRFLVRIPFFGLEITTIDNTEKRTAAFINFIDFNMAGIKQMLLYFFWDSVFSAFKEAGVVEEGDKKSAEEMLREAIKIGEIANEKLYGHIRDWLIPYLQQLLIAFLMNADLPFKRESLDIKETEKQLFELFSFESIKKQAWYIALEENIKAVREKAKQETKKRQIAERLEKTREKLKQLEEKSEKA